MIFYYRRITEDELLFPPWTLFGESFGVCVRDLKRKRIADLYFEETQTIPPVYIFCIV